MSASLQQDLGDLIAKRRIVVIIGSGVSIGATNNAPAASWTGLITLGVKRCRELDTCLDDAWESRVNAQACSSDLDDMLAAAEIVARKLKGASGAEFSRWLRETVGVMEPHDRAVLEALRDLGVPLATTNYDGLLEHVTGLPPATWRDQTRVFRVLQGEEQAILHLHGHWGDPESVVLGIRSYEQVSQDAHAQAVVRALAMTHSLLFVGCGNGLSDPNFDGFRSWLREVNTHNEARHYRLALEREVSELQKAHHENERIFVLPYGSDHKALPGYLRSLAPAHAKPAALKHLAILVTTRRMEWSRLRVDFETQARSYHDVKLSVFFVTETESPSRASFPQPNHAISLWQVYGSSDNAREKLASAKLTNFGITGAEISAFGLISGRQTDIFRKMATRAGSLLPDGVSHIITAAVSEKFAGVLGPGKPILVSNRNPLAKWVNLVLVATTTCHPERFQTGELSADPFAASLTVFDYFGLDQK